MSVSILHMLVLHSSSMLQPVFRRVSDVQGKTPACAKLSELKHGLVLAKGLYKVCWRVGFVSGLKTVICQIGDHE